MAFHIVIPARYASTRLPGKPLVEFGGVPMIVRVAQRAAQTGASTVVVATDDERVKQAVVGASIDRVTAAMTREDHHTGSDRVMEVVDQFGFADEEVVVNVQGDEPLIPPAVIEQVAGLLDDASFDVATLSEPVLTGADVSDPNLVKVVVAASGKALYFSRAPIPWARERFAPGEYPPTMPEGWRRHIGIYAYRVSALRRFVNLETTFLEQTESLEQLRLLESGIDIVVADARQKVPGGVDTPADVARVRAVIAEHGDAPERDDL